MSNEIRYPAVASGVNCGVFLNADEPARLTSYNYADAAMITKLSDALAEQDVFPEFWNKVTDADAQCSGKSKPSTGCSGKCHLCGNRK